MFKIKKMHQAERIIFAGLLTVIFCLPAFSQEPTTRIPLLSGSPKIDGKLEEDLWEKEALKIERFLQYQPKEKAEPSEKTILYLGHDKENLFLAIRCFDSQSDKIKVSMTNRDKPLTDDSVYVYIDTYHEKRRAFLFGFNPIGIQIDGIYQDEGGSQTTKLEWDTVFFSEGKIDEQGYVIEAAVPFKSLRFPVEDVMTWGFIVERTISRKGEFITWPARSRGISGVLVQSVPLTLPGDIEHGQNIEIIPTLTTLKREGEKIDAQAGVNFKYGLTSDLVIDAAINPDFSHIEADASQIDINQRYALYWTEKRPFFLEGKEIFDTPINVIYTRRIIDPLWGGRITGKTGKLSLGYISAWDQNPTESLWEIAGTKKTEDKNALFNIFRAKYDLFKESYVGFSLTDKEITGGSYNRVFGIDGQFKWKNNYYFNYQVVASKSNFPGKSKDVIFALNGQFRYVSRTWGFRLGWESIPPDFEASSGYVRRTDYYKIDTSLSWTTYPGKKYLNRIITSLNYTKFYDFENVPVEENFNIRFQFMSILNSRLFVTFWPMSKEVYEDIEFKKMRFAFCPAFYLIKWVEFGTCIWIGDGIRYIKNPYLGRNLTISSWVNFKPTSRLQVRFEYNKDRFWKSWGGDLGYDYDVLRQKTTYQITKEISARVIVDYNHYYKKIYGSFLLSYILKPGTLIFLGYDDNFLGDELGHYDRTARSMFIKFSYWLRI